jgi:F-type H+-transporting ATPase subunit delta
MRYSAAEYAQALYWVMRTKSDTEVEQAIGEFVIDMQRRGLLALLPEIQKELPAAIKTIEGIEDIVIESAYTLDDDMVKASLTALGKDEKKVEVSRIINQHLIGGIRIRGQDTVLDASFRGRLQKLKDAFVKQ